MADKEFLKDLAIAGLSTAGDIWTNQTNINQSNKQMAFQKMMSDTAAQRRVRDLIAAGLNPALAYGSEASSPSGSMAGVTNPLTTGIANAQRTKELRAQIRLLQAQTSKATQEADKTAQDKALAINNTTTAGWQSREAERIFRFNSAVQPFQERLLQTQAKLAELSIPEAEAQAKYAKTMGVWGVAARDISGLTGSVLQSAGAAAKLFAKPRGPNK